MKKQLPLNKEFLGKLFLLIILCYLVSFYKDIKAGFYDGFCSMNKKAALRQTSSNHAAGDEYFENPHLFLLIKF